MSTFFQDIQAAIVQTWNEEGSDLSGLCGKIEAGTIDSLRDKDINGNELPYLGIKAVSFGADRNEPTSAVTFPVQIECEVLHVHASQETAEDKVREILATLMLACFTEKQGNRFGIGADLTSAIQDVLLDGSGEVVAVQSPEDESMFAVIGKFTFSVTWQQIAEE